jgi:hypothetical protein
MNRNSIRGGRRNIAAHYDLGDDFYRLWLDPSMTYSSALFENAETDFEQAQRRKCNRLLDLASEGTFDAGHYAGIRLVVRGRGESYNLHLKTADVRQPWQSYRSSFRPGLEWREIQLPFSGFAPHRINGPVDTHKLRRIGIVAIGAEFTAELCVAEIGFY